MIDEQFQRKDDSRNKSGRLIKCYYLGGLKEADDKSIDIYISNISRELNFHRLVCFTIVNRGIGSRKEKFTRKDSFFTWSLFSK